MLLNIRPTDCITWTTTATAAVCHRGLFQKLSILGHLSIADIIREVKKGRCRRLCIAYKHARVYIRYPVIPRAQTPYLFEKEKAFVKSARKN